MSVGEMKVDVSPECGCVNCRISRAIRAAEAENAELRRKLRDAQKALCNPRFVYLSPSGQDAAILEVDEVCRRLAERDELRAEVDHLRGRLSRAAEVLAG